MLFTISQNNKKNKLIRNVIDLFVFYLFVVYRKDDVGRSASARLGTFFMETGANEHEHLVVSNQL